MRILLLTDADVFAGTERHMLDLALGLGELGVEVTLASPAVSPLAEACLEHAVPHVPIEKRGLVDRRAVRTLARLLHGGGIDLVHAHNGRTALQAALAIRLAGRGALVVTQHFIQPSHASRPGLAGRVSSLAHGWVNRQVDQMIAISDAVRQAQLQRGGIPPQRVGIVHNGLDLSQADRTPVQPSVREELGLHSDCPLIVCAGRLQREKNMAALINAMAELKGQSVPGMCAIVGEGDERAALQRQIDRLQLQERVRLMGFRRDARAVIADCDLFVLPSRSEPFGLVLLEAMALSRPVVAVRDGGPAEIVEHGRTGWLAAPDDPSALAAGLATLLTDPPLRQRMGVAGYERYRRRFTRQIMARSTLVRYREALGLASPAAGERPADSARAAAPTSRSSKPSPPAAAEPISSDHR